MSPASLSAPQLSSPVGRSQLSPPRMAQLRTSSQAFSVLRYETPLIFGLSSLRRRGLQWVTLGQKDKLDCHRMMWPAGGPEPEGRPDQGPHPGAGPPPGNRHLQLTPISAPVGEAVNTPPLPSTSPPPLAPHRQTRHPSAFGELGLFATFLPNQGTKVRPSMKQRSQS